MFSLNNFVLVYLRLITMNDCIVTGSCPDEQWQCTSNNQCIGDYRQCNQWNDCDDLSDELHCRPCPPTYWKCKDQSCIPLSGRCNTYYECLDGSDEENCVADIFEQTCDFEKGMCLWRLDTPRNWVIDNWLSLTDRYRFITVSNIPYREELTSYQSNIRINNCILTIDGQILYTYTNSYESWLHSPKITPALKEKCLQFKYTTEKVSSALEIYITTQNNSNRFKLQTFQYGDENKYRWMQANLILPKQETQFQISFRAMAIQGVITEMAIDDLLVTDCLKSCYDDPMFQYKNMSCSEIRSFDVNTCFNENVTRSCCNTCYDELSDLKMPINAQCKRMYGEKSFTKMITSGINLHTSPFLICNSMPCYVNNHTVGVIAAAPGTPCGHGKVHSQFHIFYYYNLSHTCHAIQKYK